MLEIVVLILACTQIGKILRAKNWRPLLMQVGTVVAYAFGAGIGGVCYAIYHYGVAGFVEAGDGALPNLGFSVYPFYILGGLVGVGGMFLIAALLPTRAKPNQSLQPTAPSGRG
jgi:hypothetical protein